MKNLLFVSTCPVPLDQGSSLHAYNFLKALTSHFRVYCIFFVPPHRDKPSSQDITNLDLNIIDYALCFFAHNNSTNKYAQLLRQSLSFPSLFMDSATNSAGLKKIKEFIHEFSIDIVHIEHFWYAKYIFKIPNCIKKIVVYHDLHHSVFKQKVAFEDKTISKISLILDWFKFYMFEKYLDNHLDVKVFLNASEMDSLPQNSVHIPHVVRSDIIFQKRKKTEILNILFLGTYSHPPNRTALEFTLDRLLPSLVQRTTNFVFHVTGPGTERFRDIVDGFSHRHLVKIEGFKADINEVFAGMDIALFPILYGGGIKTKVIDSMAAGVPVVTTPQGISGLTGLPLDCVGVGSTVDEILDELMLLIDSYDLRLKRALRAQIYIKENYSFQSFSDKVRRVYSVL